MSDLRKAAEMALSVLLDPKTTVNEVADAVKTIRQALAQPEQEPVAWMNIEDNIFYKYEFKSCAESDKNAVPLYTAPPKREWVGLTDAEVEAWRGNYDFFDSALVREVEAKLKEKNT